MSPWIDPLILAAGNVRGLPGGDPDAMPNSPTAGAVAGSGMRLPTDQAWEAAAIRLARLLDDELGRTAHVSVECDGTSIQIRVPFALAMHILSSLRAFRRNVIGKGGGS